MSDCVETHRRGIFLLHPCAASFPDVPVHCTKSAQVCKAVRVISNELQHSSIANVPLPSSTCATPQWSQSGSDQSDTRAQHQVNNWWGNLFQVQVLDTRNCQWRQEGSSDCTAPLVSPIVTNTWTDTCPGLTLWNTLGFELHFYTLEERSEWDTVKEE